MALKRREGGDQVLDLLVGHDTAHEEEGGAGETREAFEHHRARGLVVPAPVHHDGENARGLEAGGFEFLPVEFAHAEAQHRPRREGLEFAATVIAQPRQMGVKGKEELGRRDVVVHADERIGAVVHEGGGGTADREMEHAECVGPGRSLVLGKRTGETRHLRVNLLREDVRLVAAAPEVTADGQSLVPDGVAVGEGGEDLVNGPWLHAAFARRAAAISRRYFSRITGQA